MSKKITITLNDETYKIMKKKAMEINIAMSAIVNIALSEYLKREQE